MKFYGLLFIGFISYSAQAQTAFSVQQSIEYAIQNQPTLAKQKLEEDLQNEVNKEVAALTRPQVSVSGSFQYLFIVPKQRSDAGAFNFGDAFSYFVIDSAKYAANPPAPTPEYNTFQFGLPLSAGLNLQVQQIIFDPSVLIGLQARESLNELAKLNTKRSEQELRINVSKAYYNCVIAEKRKGLLDENIALITKIENTTSKLFDAGFAEKIDVARLTVQRTNLLTEKNKIDNLIKLSYSVLKFQMGMPLSNDITLTDDLNNEEIQKDMMLSNEIDYEQRTEMQLLKKGVELNNLDLRRYEKSNLPTVAATGQFGYATQTKRLKELVTLPYFPTGAVGLSVNFPIYGGGQRHAKINQVKIKLKQNEYDIQNFEQAVDFQVSNARTSLRNSLLTLKSQEDNIELAAKVYDIAQKKYKEGLGTNIEIIQAQTAMKEAQTNYFGSLYDAMLAKIDLQKALGIYK